MSTHAVPHGLVPNDAKSDERAITMTSAVVVLEAGASWPFAVIAHLETGTTTVVLRQGQAEPLACVWNRLAWRLSQLPQRGGWVREAVVCLAPDTPDAATRDRIDFCRRLLGELHASAVAHRGELPQHRDRMGIAPRLVVVMNGSGFGEQAVELGEALTRHLEGTTTTLEFRFDTGPGLRGTRQDVAGRPGAEALASSA